MSLTTPSVPSDADPRLILQAEDNPNDAELVGHRLRAQWPHCEIVHVTNRTDFLRALQQRDVSIVLSDFAMDSFNGMEALSHVRQLQPDVPFIIVSGTIGEEKAVEALKAGATDYVLKDRPARLIPAIRRALEDAAQSISKRETEERFRQLAETSNDVFWFADLNPFRVRYVSPAVANIWGHKPEELYADPDLWLARVHAEDRQRVKQNFNAWLAGERIAFNEEFRVIRPDGSCRWVYDMGTFTADASGKTQRINGVVRDITLAKEATEQSLRAQRLESIGLLAGGIAHDLNNALAPVLMGLELLESKVGTSDRPLFDQMRASTNRGAAMVRQLLGFARGAEGQRSILSPGRVLREVEQLAQSTFPKEIVTTLRVAPDLPNIEADPTLLHQVLLNLAVNARDAMPHGGSLVLEAESMRVDESYAGFIPDAKPGQYIVFNVSDTGIGIPADVLPKIFDPFFTTKPQGVGTGLGLTTVAGIVHNHAGFVRVYSEERKGTCFKVFLPAVYSDAQEAPQRIAIPDFAAQGQSVLVVDDEESVRLLLRGLLARFGFRVYASSDGAEAIATFAAHRAEINLVITDERMPHMDGMALVRALRHLSSGVRIIAMSGLHSESRVREFTAAGVAHFLHKPFAIDQLIAALHNCLACDEAQTEFETIG